MDKVTSKGNVLGGTLLVAGTAIGGGMLALPVLTSPGGFIPAVAMYILCWLFMASTGILLMEVFLWSKNEVNIVSMARMTLGRLGQISAWILYLYLFYSLTVAYVSGGGNLVNDLFDSINCGHYPRWIGPLIFVGCFAPFVAIGARAVDRINVILMGGLIISFLAFVFLGIHEVNHSQLLRMNWPLALIATPVMFTSFGFQGIVPTLTQYMGRNPIRTKRAIWIGSTIPLIAYIIWEWLILGVVPESGLSDALLMGQSAVYPLKNCLQLPWLYRVGEFFAFFAIVTSFLGVTLGLLDFLADGLKIKKTSSRRVGIAVFIFLPPLAFTMINPNLFLNALHYAGGLGCALLLGLLPILMVWRGRYALKLQSAYSLPGGRFLLTLLIIFILLELALMALKFGT